MDFLFGFLVVDYLIAEGLDLVEKEKVVVEVEVKLALVLGSLAD
jgi:hypothetical protein